MRIVPTPHLQSINSCCTWNSSTSSFHNGLKSLEEKGNRKLSMTSQRLLLVCKVIDSENLIHSCFVNKDEFPPPSCLYETCNPWQLRTSNNLPFVPRSVTILLSIIPLPSSFSVIQLFRSHSVFTAGSNRWFKNRRKSEYSGSRRDRHWRYRNILWSAR